MADATKSQFPVTLREGEDGYVVAECPILPGCISQGETRQKALENIKEAIAVSLETRKAYNLPPRIEMIQVEIAVS
ncbi:MAG: type II toxin-antitoxin system HicB family antitoxin [Bacillota bacterium]